MKPMLAVMHDYGNGSWAELRPNWGPVGAWMWWGWSELWPDPRVKIEPYLTEAARQGKPVALSVMLYPDLNRDCTPTEVGGKWVVSATGKPDIFCPGWGIPKWEQAYADFVKLLGAWYDGDPRIHSWWICTGRYGETIFEAEGYSLMPYYAQKFVIKALDWWQASFTKTPVMLIATGTPDRRYYCEEAAARGVGVKFNALQPDGKNAWLKGGGGLAECAEAVMARVPMGYEHAFANNEAQMYWSLLYALTFGARVIDLPTAYLDTLAAMKAPSGEPLWEWTLAQMDATTHAFWIARQTATPVGDWEHGYLGAYIRGIEVVGGTVELRANAQIAPADLQNYIASYGIGKISAPVEFAITLDADKRRVWAVVSSGISLAFAGQTVTAQNAGWNYLAMEGAGDKIKLTGAGFVHMVGADTLPADIPPEPAPPDGCMSAVGKLLAAIFR